MGGDPAQAVAFHLAALDVRHRGGYLPGVAESLEHVALLAAALRRFSEGARILGAAQALREVTGCWPNSSPSWRPDLDDMISALGRDRFDTLRAEGAGLSVDEAITRAGEVLDTGPRPRSGWGSLTSTERAVALMAAAGHANPQIATQLSLARGSVENALTRVFTKLGIASRTQLAIEVAKSGTG
jgi:DNA-binding CsgD family transcriptional regulator